MHAVVKIAKSVWWYLGAVVGDHDYDNYVAHRRQAHPGCEVLSKRDYWRERYANQDNNPASRCC
ncbi:YbdD/YjiX family protein [Corynebacterium sp. SCR221107]|uniref:YbdD/YjiX family protein n=1 Tax=Corynebacterium sp. SCR221107 TaxID=3017361 RepID=UPI0022EC34E6|nr:YbdD/YjiX family protein [Corynebacterium sp. SCR221107]WBT07880.1 YbdD/YjiX family protein [Corynebacterium sp. SCR221107]